MKHDSYARFLKSPLYKQSVLAEMEGKPLPFADLVALDNGHDDENKNYTKVREMVQVLEATEINIGVDNFHAALTQQIKQNKMGEKK